jgi:hypothetical protein
MSLRVKDKGRMNIERARAIAFGSRVVYKYNYHLNDRHELRRRWYQLGSRGAPRDPFVPSRHSHTFTFIPNPWALLDFDDTPIS